MRPLFAISLRGTGSSHLSTGFEHSALSLGYRLILWQIGKLPAKCANSIPQVSESALARHKQCEILWTNHHAKNFARTLDYHGLALFSGIFYQFLK
jgi:hypothetical protein